MQKILFYFVFLSLLFIDPIYSQSLPPVKLDYSSHVVSFDGKVLGYFGNKKRVEIKSTSAVSKYVVWCLIATEDRDFYNHDGVSYKGLVRGVLKTITGSTQGGSTLTMQLARNLFLNHERSLGRKINEIDLAKKLEEKYSKDQILLLYLNTVYFGRGAHGIWAASQEYFQKTPDKLTIPESAVLVGLLQSPSGYDPEKNPDRLLSRRNEVMDNLVEVGKITSKEYQKFKKTPLSLNLRKNTGRHFLEYVRKQSSEIVNKMGLKLSEDQLKISTTLDYRLQVIAEKNIETQWESLPVKNKDIQVGLISLDPVTGFIKAMVGGNPESEARGLNRSVQIKRQPGSSFKPFLYGAMLSQGFTLATPLLDSPIVIDQYKPTEWRPSNSDDSYTGKNIPMIEAIEHSVNLAAAYAITKLTCPDSVISFARLCGISSYIPPYPSIALGTAEMSPLEIASGYAVFASMGNYSNPVAILKIEDKKGNVIYSGGYNTPLKVLDSADCYLITKSLEKVISGGTATSVRNFYKGPAAGKTGTTQNSADVWFAGYTSELSTAIWMGYDSPKRKLSGGFQYGGTACAPLWGKIMKEYSAYRNSASFIQPGNIEEFDLCTESGELATDKCPSWKKYPVNTSRIPYKCRIHSPVVEKYELHYSF
jgi:1A family penicillin-binding protein